MYLSKIQVKNLVKKELGKYSISKSLKGRICYFSTPGYKFEDKNDGFIKVWFSSGSGEYAQELITKKNIIVLNILLNLGFEFDGVDAFRKAR